jgi:hypothetical protein
VAKARRGPAKRQAAAERRFYLEAQPPVLRVFAEAPVVAVFAEDPVVALVAP